MKKIGFRVSELASGDLSKYSWDPAEHSSAQKKFNPFQLRGPDGRWARNGSGKSDDDISNRLGRCYELSGKYTSDHAGSTLVHGSIQGFGHPRIGHAWVVTKSGDIWEPATNQTYPEPVFDAIFHPQIDKTYSQSEALEQMVQHETYGPWDTEKSAETPELASTHRPLGTHGLWGRKPDQLPAYIQNIAHAMIRDGHDEGSAISLAVAAVKRWAAGGNHVTPEVQAAAGAALAEWEKLRAEHAAKSKGDDMAEKVPFTATEKFPGDDDFLTAADKQEILDAIDPAASVKKNAKVTVTVNELAELVKLGGPEGYIHGYVCVRPPCGDKPPKIKPADLAVQRDGGIVHRPSGYSVGHVAKDETGKWTASHADGAETTHGSRGNALKAVARRYNSGKTGNSLSGDDSASSDAAPDVSSPSVETSGSHDELPNPGSLPKPSGAGVLAYLNRQSRVYTDTQVKSLQNQLNKLQAELHQEKHKEKKMSVAIELGSVAAAVGLAFVTGGLSLGLLGPALVHEAPNIGKALAEWVHGRLSHTENPFTPLRAGEKSAQSSATATQQEQVVSALAQLISQPGLSQADAQSFSSLVVAQAAKALAAGRFPGDDGFISADDVQSVKDALSPGRVTVKVRDLIDMADEITKVGPHGWSHGWVRGAVPDQRTANRLNMTTKPKDLARTLSDKELAGAEVELTRRAISLGKPGQISRAHQAVRDEISRRKTGS
jgi:uncharacterized protein YdaT